MLLNDADARRDLVREAYTRAIKGVDSGCCGGASPEATLAEAAAGCCATDYDAKDTEAHPEAAGASFGCGNPLAMADVRLGETVLDLGAGAGFDLLVAADRVGPSGQVIGVDMTEAMIEVAQRNVARAGVADRVDVREGLIESLPVDDASVDHVISNCVINLSPDKPAVFAEIARVLKPGGRFSVADVVAEDLSDELRASVEAFTGCIAGAIGEQEYLEGLRAAGLEDVKVVDRVRYPIPGEVASVRITGRRAG